MDLFLAQEAVPVHAFDQAEPGEPGGHVKIALLAVAQVFDVALHDVEAGVRFSRNPIYATLHESSYADGVATRWSAQRLLPDEVEEEGYFTAEHVFPWMWEDYAALRPQRDAAGLLAEHEWPALYDAHQLRNNEVPVAATIYVNDLYVERDFAKETAATIRGLRTWETDEFEHNGLRADGERVLGRLIDLVRGRA